MEKLNLAYLTPNSARSYNFYLIPKELIDNPAFDEVDYGSKILYGLMLNRASLSAVNSADFTDKNGNIYIIYTVEQVMADMRCSNKTAIKMLKQLDDIGLIEKRRQGQGKPSIVYVKDFSTVQFKNCKKYNSRSVKSTLQEVKNVHGSNPNQKNQNLIETNSITSAEVRNIPIDTIDILYTPEYINKTVKNNIDIHSLKTRHPLHNNEIQELFDLVLETLISKKHSFRIAQENMPPEIVKNAFLRLNTDHIDYIITNLKKNTTKVKSIKSYLLTSLFNASKTINNHISLDIQNNIHDIFDTDILDITKQ
jgi:hypothetical protein